MMDTIIFDLDGVLIDSEPLKKKAEVGALFFHKINISKAKINQYLKTEPIPDGSHYQQFVSQFSNLPFEVLYKTRVEVYKQLVKEELKLIPGALDFLKFTRKYLKKGGLVTSSRPHSTEAVFDRFKIEKYFDAIINGSHYENSKPHPEPYLKALLKLGSEAKQAIAIEDSPAGIQSAKAAGCRVMAITTSFTSSYLKKSKLDYVVDSFKQAEKIIGLFVPLAQKNLL